MKAHDGMYIDGAWRPAAGTDTIAVVNPADEREIGQVPAGTAEDVDAAVRAARAALPRWAATPPAERGALIGALRDVLAARQDEIAETVTAELGSPPPFAQRVQAGLPITVAGSYAELAATYAFEEKVGNLGRDSPLVSRRIHTTPRKHYPPARLAGAFRFLRPSILTPIARCDTICASRKNGGMHIHGSGRHLSSGGYPGGTARSGPKRSNIATHIFDTGVG
jgi:hypothetical protein